METAIKVIRILFNLALFVVAIWLAIISASNAWYVWIPVIAIPILFIFLCITLMESSPSQPGSAWYVLARVQVGILVVFGVAFALLFSPMQKARHLANANREFLKKMESNAMQVCKSLPAPEAAAYNPVQAGVHPIVFFYGNHKAWEEKPRWKPAQVADTQLVACTDGSDTERGICFFQNGGQKYYHVVRFVYLYNASTGELLAEKRWICEGSCPGELTDENAHELCAGYQLPFSEAIQWLEPYVETE